MLVWHGQSWYGNGHTCHTAFSTHACRWLKGIDSLFEIMFPSNHMNICELFRPYNQINGTEQGLATANCVTMISAECPLNTCPEWSLASGRQPNFNSLPPTSNITCLQASDYTSRLNIWGVLPET